MLVSWAHHPARATPVDAIQRRVEGWDRSDRALPVLSQVIAGL